MSFKKYDGSVWQSINPKQLKGVPYSGTLPAVLAGTKAGYLHRYKIYGNLSQNGTPTPSEPIYPSECGERTENLFDKNNQDGGVYSILQDGSIGTGATSYAIRIPCESSTTYTCCFTLESLESTVWRITTTESLSYPTASTPVTGTLKVYDSSASITEKSTTFTTGADDKYIWIQTTANIANEIYAKLMLTEGSTALPYEPYGYKLPLLSGSTPVDIYLGESQTTRQIKKLELTGKENWRIDDGRFTFKVTDIYSRGLRLTEFYCTHYQVISDGRAYADVPNNAIYTGGRDSSGAIFYIHTDAYTTTTSFKAYLAEQYSNGTPVTIWYPLMTPTTGTLNEPLRKIGDYVDTIDSTQSSVQIPTTANSTTISWAGQGLAPSEFDSIQEWVDIPTYTYTNGEWVADNSN